MNTLYYGDNLKILREYIKDESVDLVYLDPPFNSNRNYNVLFKDESGGDSDSQITAFEDTWHWNHTAEETYRELVLAGDDVSKMIEAFRSFIGTNQMMAYLVMMAVRLKELHRVLKNTGSLYLHCDPTASHYLKVLLDTIFGGENFRNEINWKRTTSHNDAKRRFGNVCDVIFFYTKGSTYSFNVQYSAYSQEYINQSYRYIDEKGRRYTSDNLRSPNPRPNLTYEYKGYKPHANGWTVSRERMEQLDAEGRLIFPSSPDGRIRIKKYLDEMPGVPVSDVWDDIPVISSQAAERLGYPTQKPITLLERIVAASSNEGDVVLDPFCGCGTTIAAAQKLNRQWIGIDITHLSIALQKYRLKDAFGLEPVGTKKSVPPAVAGGLAKPAANPEASEPQPNASGNPPLTSGGSDKIATYRIIGEPEDLDGARQLASEDRYQFQWWALSLIKARPLGGNDKDKTGKKGADKGIDGTITFIDDNTAKAKRVIVSVKSGGVSVPHIRDLGHVIDREQAAIGVYLTLEPPTKPMITEALQKGFYHSPGWNRDYPRLQILTIEDLLAGKQVDMPPSSVTFKQAEKMNIGSTGQASLGFEVE